MAEEDKNDQEPKVVRVSYGTNSNKSKQQKPADEKPPVKKIEKVIQGEAVQRKKGIGRKIRDTFAGDDMHSVGNFILFDVIAPAVKTMISDAISQGVERTLFGESSSRSRRTSIPVSNRYSPYTSYSKSSVVGRAGEADGPRTLSSRARATHDFDEIVLATRGEAQLVLDTLAEAISQYDVATVSDLLDMVGIAGSFTDEKWGWTDLRGAGVQRVREGYLLNLPKPVPLD